MPREGKAEQVAQRVREEMAAMGAMAAMGVNSTSVERRVQPEAAVQAGAVVRVEPVTRVVRAVKGDRLRFKPLGQWTQET